MVKMEKLPDDIYTAEDLELYKKLSRKDVLTLLIYNKNLYFAGESRPIDHSNPKVRTEMRGGTTVAPLKVFTLFEGVKLSENVLTYGEKKVEIERSGFTVPPFTYLEHSYVPLAETAEALGLKATSFYQGRLTVIGKETEADKIFEAINKNPNLAAAGADFVTGKYDAYKFTHEDYKTARDKWRKCLVGSRETIDMNDEGMVKKIKTLTQNARRLLSEMNRSGSAPILWGDTPPSESGDLIVQYHNVRSLALAYGTYGTDFYLDDSIKADILYALQWMYENMYGEAEIEERGWRSINAFNWWDWYVGANENLTDILLIMEDCLSKEQIHKYMKLPKYLLDHWRLKYTQDQCSGRMTVGTKCALILEDPERLTIASNDYHILLNVVLEGPGTHTDYCNYQHGFPYNLMYGTACLSRVLSVGTCLAGTPLEFASSRVYNIYDQFKYMFDAASFRGRGFVCFNGRASCIAEIEKGYELAALFTYILGKFGPEEDEAVRRFIKYSMPTEKHKAAMKDRCSIPTYSAVRDALSDDTLPSEDTKNYAHAWFSADRATQHRNGYAFLLSMPSYRHISYECINHNNVTGWYMNDGALYLYTKTDDHEFDGINFVLNERIAYHIPGTTTDSRQRLAVSISEGWYPENDRVGCMDFEKEFITAGMDYSAYNLKEAEIKEDVGYGAGNPKFINDLVAKKAYFMFDDACVCLGADISSTMNSDISTTVEHRRLVKLQNNPCGSDRISVNGECITENTFDLHIDAPRYACVEDFAGFLFMDAPKVTVSKYLCAPDYDPKDAYSPVPRPEKFTRPFVEITIDHGKNPVNASYAYAVLPYADDEKLKKCAEDPDFEIISNTDKIQAVKEKSLGITGMIFYEAGECAGIKVNRSCLVTYKETGGEFKIKVCEPTNKVDSLEIEIDKKLSLLSCDNRYSIECGKNTKLTLNTARSQGEGYEAKFRAE